MFYTHVKSHAADTIQGIMYRALLRIVLYVLPSRAAAAATACRDHWGGDDERRDDDGRSSFCLSHFLDFFERH